MFIILCKMGELVLKGLNRSRFESALLTDLRAKLAPHGEFTVTARQSAIYAEPLSPDCDMAAAYAAASRVFGIAALSHAVKCPKDMSAIIQAAVTLPGVDQPGSFKVEARRADKTFPLTSPQICAEVGGAVLEQHPHLTVNVHNPAQVLWVEIRDDAAYLHIGADTGAGGLPYGTSGKAVLLLSGGIDSPVAGWRMARRGLSLIPLHFHSYPYTSPEALEKVKDLAKQLTLWCGGLTMHTVSLTQIQENIRRHTPAELSTVLTRRSMCRIASALAYRTKASALITGDSLGQVASQTLEGMAVTSEASSIPILRPLIGMDKEEIVRTARQIGSFDISSLPYEDCCGLFTPKHPRTKPTLEECLKAEASFDYTALESEALSASQRLPL